MKRSLCSNRIVHIGRGKLGGTFCSASRRRCTALKAFFCISADVARFVFSSVLMMFLIGMEDS